MLAFDLSKPAWLVTIKIDEESGSADFVMMKSDKEMFFEIHSPSKDSTNIDSSLIEIIEEQSSRTSIPFVLVADFDKLENWRKIYPNTYNHLKRFDMINFDSYREEIAQKFELKKDLLGEYDKLLFTDELDSTLIALSYLKIYINRISSEMNVFSPPF